MYILAFKFTGIAKLCVFDIKMCAAIFLKRERNNLTFLIGRDGELLVPK